MHTVSAQTLDLLSEPQSCKERLYRMESEQLRQQYRECRILCIVFESYHHIEDRCLDIANLIKQILKERKETLEVKPALDEFQEFNAELKRIAETTSPWRIELRMMQ